MGIGRRLFIAITRISSPITLRLAGTGLIPIWGVLHHRGRKSGRAYATPLAVIGRPDGFVLPLPFGEGTDWCRNVRAVGGVLHWRGADHRIERPEIISAAAASAEFNAVLRPIVRLLGIKKFVRVRHTVSLDSQTWKARVSRTA